MAVVMSGWDGSKAPRNVRTNTNTSNNPKKENSVLLADPEKSSATANKTNGLTDNQNAQISQLQKMWSDAQARNDQAGMDNAHKEAERIRASAGLTGGADGSTLTKLPRQQRSALDGGYTWEDVDQWAGSYNAANTKNGSYTNGYNANMNNRSIANFIRQQMLANSNAWANASAAERDYLHQQNVQLANVLAKYNGGAQSTFNESLGRWETNNGNLGYGYDLSQKNDPDWKMQYYGLTADDLERYANDTSRYSNFVDTNHRGWIDESNGFTGQYAEYVNGPYAQHMTAGVLGRPNRALDTNLIGDGFHDETDYANVPDGLKNADGTWNKQLPYLKGGNADPYTQSKAAYIENGVIMPGMLDRQRVQNREQNMWINGGNPVADTGENYGVRKLNYVDRNAQGGGVVKWISGGPDSASGVGSYEDQLNQMYDAQLQAQIAQLEAAYNQSIADLDRTLLETQQDSLEQRRQTTGDAEKQQAAWREVANAQGYNSGAIGQSSLVSGGQLQGNLNAINSLEATKQAEIERQRALAAQSFQMQIEQARAENDFERVQSLLVEAQRVDAALREQQQFESQQMMQMLQMMQGGG